MDYQSAIEILNKYEYSTKLELSEGINNDICNKITVKDFLEMKDTAIKALIYP